MERLPKEFHSQTTQTMNVTGDNNKSGQISVTGNFISIGRPVFNELVLSHQDSCFLLRTNKTAGRI